MVKPTAGTKIRESGDSFALGLGAFFTAPPRAGAARLEGEGWWSVIFARHVTPSVAAAANTPISCPGSKSHTAPATIFTPLPRHLSCPVLSKMPTAYLIWF